MTHPQYTIGRNWSKSRYIGLPTATLMAHISTAFSILPTASAPDYIDGCIDGITELVELRVRERPLSKFLEEF